MKSSPMLALAFALGATSASAAGLASAVSPLEKVQQLLADQASKITKEGAEAKKLYEEFAAICESRSAELEFEIKTGSSDVEEQRAVVESTTATITVLSTKVEELVAAVASQEKELKEASEVRAKDAADYAAEEKELLQILDMVGRAITVIEREQRKGGSLAQLSGAKSLADAMGVMVQASVFSAADADRLSALLQTQNEDSDSSEDEDLSFGAPAAAAYESKSGGVVAALKDMKDKAASQLEEARKREQKSLHAYELVKQSLEDQTRLANKDLAEAQKGIADNGQKKSVAQGALTSASKELEADKQALEDLHHDCVTRAQDYEAETRSREEEIKVISEAKKIIAESTGGASEATYGLAQVSLLQLRSRASSKAKDMTSQMNVVHLVRSLSRRIHTASFTQLANRVDALVAAASETGADPFAKIRGLISEMLERLEAEAAEDASHKAFCDKEMGETQANFDAKKTEEDKLNTKIDQMSARSAQLQAEVATLQKGLAALAASQAEMDSLREKEQTLYQQSKADLDAGLDGVKRALKVLRDYYGSGDQAAGGAGSGIIGLLEVVESDFAKGLAETVSTEEAAKATYKKQTQDNQLEKVTKEKDVEYKNRESAELDKAVAEAKADLAHAETELTAIDEYFTKLKEQCVAKAEPYEAKKAARENEIAGLKQALDVLDNEAALLQTSVRRVLRGIKPHA